MCFKNLPVEFDEQGNARLKEGVADPFSYEVTEVTPNDGVVRLAANARY